MRYRILPKFYSCDFLLFPLPLSFSSSFSLLSRLSAFSAFYYLPTYQSTPLHETPLASSRVMQAQTTRAKWEARAFLIYPLELKHSTHVQHGVECNNMQPYQLKHIILLCYFKMTSWVSRVYLNSRRKDVNAFFINYFQANLLETSNVIIILTI